MAGLARRGGEKEAAGRVPICSLKRPSFNKDLTEDALSPTHQKTHIVLSDTSSSSSSSHNPESSL